MTATFEYDIDDLTVSFTASSTTGFYTVQWAFGDGTSGIGLTPSHTYDSYGTKNVVVSYIEIGTGNPTTYKGKVLTFTLKDPNNLDPVDITTTNIFKDKPFYLPPACTGDVVISASIEQLQDKILYTSGETKVWSASINFAQVPIEGTATIELYVDPSQFESHPSDSWIVSNDYKIENLNYIPAFYDRGEILVEPRLGLTEDENSSFDVTCEMNLQFPSFPAWYEGTLTYGSKVTENLVNSDNSETNVGTVSVGSHSTWNFTMGTWSGIPPIEVKEVIDHNKDSADQTMIKRGCLSSPQFQFLITNKLESKVVLSSIMIKFYFYYTTTNMLMDVRQSGSFKQEVSKLFTLAKGTEENRVTGLDYPLFGITEGYDDGEIVKVFGFYQKWLTDELVYYPSCIVLSAVEGTYGTDYPTFLWKSERVVTTTDFERMAYKGMSGGDYIKVLTPQVLAYDDHYRIIDVSTNDVDESSTEFTITTVPNSTIDDKVTIEELQSYISKIKFFDAEIDYASSVVINRSQINPIFYETLYKTYRKAPVLQSTMGEPLNYVNFTINDYGSYFPIFNGGSIELSNNLRHCDDGIRSSEVLNFSNTEANNFGIYNPTKYKYKVKFKADYGVYEDMYVEENFE